MKYRNKTRATFFFTIVLLSLISFQPVKSLTLEEIASYDLTNCDLIKPINTRTLDLLTSSKSSAGRYLYLEFELFFGKYMNLPEKNRYIVEAESETGEKVTFSLAETYSNVSKIPPFILMNKVEGRTGDTIKIHELKSGKGKLDMDALEKEAQKVYLFRIVTNVASKEALRQSIGKMTLFFPQDLSTQRWLKNVRWLRLYLIK